MKVLARVPQAVRRPQGTHAGGGPGPVSGPGFSWASSYTCGVWGTWSDG
jgi:hypothetical protein